MPTVSTTISTWLLSRPRHWSSTPSTTAAYWICRPLAVASRRTRSTARAVTAGGTAWSARTSTSMSCSPDDAIALAVLSAVLVEASFGPAVLTRVQRPSTTQPDRPPVPSGRRRDLRPGSEGRTNLVRTVSCTHRRDMRPVLQRRRPRPEPGPEHARIVEAVEVTGHVAAMLPPVAAGSRACCCSAAPAFQVVLPPGADRTPAAEILFCGHHYREHRGHLRARGAAIYDCTGLPVDPPE